MPPRSSNGPARRSRRRADDSFRDGDALITRARAELVALFLDDPAATHLLFVDADIRPGRQIWADLQLHLDQLEPATFHGDVTTQFEAPVKLNDAA
jgi:hypothetical protein